MTLRGKVAGIQIYHKTCSTVTWLIAHVSWLPCHLPAQKQQYLSGIYTIFQTVPDTGSTAGYNVTVYGRCTVLHWEPVERGLHKQSHFK